MKHKLLSILLSLILVISLLSAVALAAEGTTGDGTQASPYTLTQLSTMTRDQYIAAQKALGGTMYVTVGDYSYDTHGTLGHGVRNDKTGQTEDRSVLNGYNSNGYLNEEGEDGKKNDGANGKNIVFVGGTITSGATGYTSIDNIGTSLLLAVPAYTNVTFKGTTFKNVFSFNYQLYTGPWSQLGELKFDGCTFNGIIVGAIAAQKLTFNGCTFTDYTNTTDANSSNPTWIRPAYGNWTKGDNEGQGGDFRSLTEINFTNNTVTSTRPVKFEYISQWDIRSKVTATDNYFDISSQETDKATKIKNVGLYLGAHTDANAFDLVVDNNTKSDNTAALYTIPEGKTSLPAGSTVKDSSGNEITLNDALKWKGTKDEVLTLKTECEAKIGDAYYATLADAITAANNGDTVTLLKDTNLPDAEYYINKSVTINGSGKISCTVKTGEATCAFVVENNGSLTLDGVELDIQGTKNSDSTKNNDGTGIDVQYGGSLILKNRAVLNLHDLERATISSKPDGSQANPGQFVIDNSTFNSTNIDGNISNGGDWKVTNGSTVNINTCGSYGLSVDSLTTEQSTVNASGTGYSAIYGKDLQFKDGSNVLINGAGTKLPLQSKWSDARSPIQTHKDGGTIVVESGATVTVRDCVDKDKKANDTIYLPNNTTYRNNGTVNATIITADAPENFFVVTLVSDGKTIGVQTVQKGSEFTLPAAPEKNNYTFNGWYDGSKFYAAGASYTVSATVTLNAVWRYNFSGGGFVNPTYPVSAPSQSENGTVTISPKYASRGDTVTITVKPDSGYVLGSLTVTDSNGNRLPLTAKGDGQYTFVMPDGGVEVKATFTKEAETSPFADVATDAYCYEAVKWAVGNGITTGVGGGLFAPAQPCTRAQIVTFLWRAAGSPEPNGTAAGMTDVISGSYYEKAVAWAIENGITTGTTATTFSPDDPCTRAQAVTFLARALHAEASGTANFRDVPANSYFANAVAWAAANGVAEGVGSGLFAPDSICTRGQIVTFLFRAYSK